MKKLLQTLSQKWPEYLLEILVLIIGIYGAFELENWNAERQNRAKEQIILGELNREFRENKAQLEVIIKAHKKSMRAAEKIKVQFPIDTKKANLDSLGKYLWEIYSTYTFNPSQGTINSIISTSSFDLISDQKLRSLIVSWKDVYEDYREDELRASNDAINYLAPFLNDHFPFKMNLRDPRFDPDILSSLDFENQVFQRHSNLISIVENDEDELEKLLHHIDQIIELTK